VIEAERADDAAVLEAIMSDRMNNRSAVPEETN